MISMPSKKITIREEVYNLLMRLKREDESFSDLLERLVKRNSSVELLERMAGTIEFGDTELLISEIREKRKKWREE